MQSELSFYIDLPKWQKYSSQRRLVKLKDWKKVYQSEASLVNKIMEMTNFSECLGHYIYTVG